MEEFLQVIKDYGAAIIGTLSVGGVATIGAVIAKIYKAFNALKEKTESALSKKDKALNDTTSQMQAVVDQNKQLISKINVLTDDIQKLESEVKDVKGNRKN